MLRPSHFSKARWKGESNNRRAAEIEAACRSLPFLVLLGSGCITLLPRPDSLRLTLFASRTEPLAVSSAWKLQKGVGSRS